MTFFGQFFDHGLDLVTKGGSGTVFIPLQPDDPLFNAGADGFRHARRRPELHGPHPGHQPARARRRAGHRRRHPRAHQPRLRPSSTRTRPTASHPSHQVFLRAYELNVAGEPVATGKLIVNRDLGAGWHSTARPTTSCSAAWPPGRSSRPRRATSSASTSPMPT
ncbi:MAG: hypothetical protein M0C28_31845 [Candidatus Moduliflexus flocculans]|nr:hypothetical protein [Candidatus Moduliflexus flocculans]